MNKPEVLIVDDDTSFVAYVTEVLRCQDYGVKSVGSGEQLFKRLATMDRASVILLDMMLPGASGLEILAELSSSYPGIPVIMLTAVGQAKRVVEAMRVGASDYLTKPFEEQELELAIEAALQKKRLQEEVLSLRKQLAGAGEPGNFISKSARVAQIKEIARHVAGTDVPVLILGESGVGKEVLARFIHAQGDRAGEPFVKVNCAALPDELLESELFGYERGAFTGALGEKPGKFELAQRGTILLDEIGEMSPHLQAKLLHVLQDGEYTRLGGKRPATADARVLASTNRKLRMAISKGEFREDLYYRLNVVSIEIPSLRERPEDIPLLCRYLVEKYADRYRSSIHELPAELMNAFVNHQWPGNVRELENLVRRFLILPDVAATLKLLGSLPVEGPPPVPEKRGLKTISSEVAESAEKELIFQTLARTNWNRKQTASEVEISYKALLNKLKKWDARKQVKIPPPSAGPDTG